LSKLQLLIKNVKLFLPGNSSLFHHPLDVFAQNVELQVHPVALPQLPECRYVQGMRNDGNRKRAAPRI
jgi:hypothetical protein